MFLVFFFSTESEVELPELPLFFRLLFRPPAIQKTKIRMELFRARLTPLLVSREPFRFDISVNHTAVTPLDDKDKCIPTSDEPVIPDVDLSELTRTATTS